MNFIQKALSYIMPPQPAATTADLKKFVKRAYEAARPSDQFKKIASSLSPNSATMTGTEKLRDQARYLDENHDLSISILDTLVSKVVGKSINVTPMVKGADGELDEEVNDQIKKLWKIFEERPEITRQMNMAQADRLTCRTWLRDGEALNRFIIGTGNGLEHKSPVPMSIELIEPDYLPFIKNERFGNTKIIQGVELHKWGYPLFYHLLTQSPYEIYPGAVSGLGLETMAIPANQILHIKFVRRMTQIRGVTIFHGIMRRLENIKDYEESEQIAARVAAAFTAFIKKDLETPGDFTGAEARNLEMVPGMIFDDLAPGEDVGMIASDRPNTGLLDFRNSMLRAACAGAMANFSSVAKYYDGSYSSQRQEIVESKANYDILRDVFISEIKKPVYMNFVNLALEFGHVRLSPGTDIETIFHSEISGIPMPWIDPKKEMDAFKIAREEKFISRSGIIRIMGNDPVEVNAETEKETENEPGPVKEAEPEPSNQEGEENEEDE